MKSNSPKKRAAKKATSSSATTSSKSAPKKPATAAKTEAISAKAGVETGQAARTKAKSSTASKQRPARKPAKSLEPKPTQTQNPPTIPEILFEDDRPTAHDESGPGTRFALGAAGGTVAPISEGELPESYGTGKLILAARDPHWLYASWDFTRNQLRSLNRKSPEGHLRLRIFQVDNLNEPVSEVAVHPESRHWFVHVAESDTRYVGCLGYRTETDAWSTVSESTPTLAPADTLSPDTNADFATIPLNVPLSRLTELFQVAAQEQSSLAQAVHELREDGRNDLPDPLTGADRNWTPQQEQAMAALISVDEMRRVWMGSLEITELIRRQLGQHLSSGELSSFSIAPGDRSSARGWESVTSPSVSSFGENVGSSPSGSWAGAPGQEGFPDRSFWFNVNAELIIYGATEPDATVTIGGRTIRLRADGTFSYRFALPDGRYALPVMATSEDGVDQRSAGLEFARQSEYRGHVEAHPQDPSLKPPLKEHVA